jgi:hypothetical protein
VDVSTALTTSIRELLAGIGLGEDYLHDPLRTLVRDARLAVRSFLGLQLTMAVDRQYPVRVSSFGPGIECERINTSLRVPLATLGQPDPAANLTFYAAIPGAFVDLAADLGFALQISEQIALDRDLVPMSLVSGVFGVAELTVINQAIGILIDQGHDPGVASSFLRHRAAVSGVTTHHLARQLVQGVAHGPG